MNRIVFSQSRNGAITQYTYLRDCAETITDVSCMDYKQVKCCGAIHIESSQYHVHYEYKANDKYIKYACVTEDGKN